ncbi:MAG: glycosylase, partial [Sphingobacteriales bacterium]
MNRFKIILFLVLSTFSVQAQVVNSISQAEMEKIYQEVKTPFKYGLVMVPDDKD